jgi:hypothetical protein
MTTFFKKSGRRGIIIPNPSRSMNIVKKITKKAVLFLLSTKFLKIKITNPKLELGKMI